MKKTVLLITALATPLLAQARTIKPLQQASAAKRLPATTQSRAEHIISSLKNIKHRVSFPAGICPTLYYIEARQNAKNYSPSQQRELENILARPTHEELYGAAVTVNTHSNVGSNFLIHYTTTGIDAVIPTDIHGPSGLGGADGVPDYVNDVADQYDIQSAAILALGYPFPPDDSGLDDYLEDSNPDTRFDVYLLEARLSLNAYGLTIGEGDIIGSDSLTSAMIIDTHLNDLEMRATIAHEFHHAVQFGMAAYADSWIWEATSTWMESYLHADDTYALGWMPGFFSNPTDSLSDPDYYGYSRYIWLQFLEENYSANIILDIWDDLGNTTGPQTHSAYPSMANALGGNTQLGDAFQTFSQWNADTSNYTRFNGLIPPIYSPARFTGDDDTLVVSTHALASAYARISTTASDKLYLSFWASAQNIRISIGLEDLVGNITWQNVPLNDDDLAEVTLTNVSSATLSQIWIVNVNVSTSESSIEPVDLSYSRTAMPISPSENIVTAPNGNSAGGGGGGGGGGGCLLTTLK